MDWPGVPQGRQKSHAPAGRRSLKVLSSLRDALATPIHPPSGALLGYGLSPSGLGEGIPLKIARNHHKDRKEHQEKAFDPKGPREKSFTGNVCQTPLPLCVLRVLCGSLRNSGQIDPLPKIFPALAATVRAEGPKARAGKAPAGWPGCGRVQRNLPAPRLQESSIHSRYLVLRLRV